MLIRVFAQEQKISPEHEVFVDWDLSVKLLKIIISQYMRIAKEWNEIVFASFTKIELKNAGTHAD